MARGYPDFFGMSIFPSYGPLKKDGSNGNLLPSSTQTFTLVTGKGRIRAVEIAFLDAAAFEEIVVTPTVDGQGMGAMPINSMIFNDAIMNPYAWARAVIYDRTGTCFIGRLLEDVTYGQEISLTIENPNAADTVSYAYIVWYHDYVAG